MLICASVPAGVYGTSASSVEPPAPLLPEEKGVEKVRAFCSLCHGVELVAQQRLDRAGWVRIVDQMVEFGAPVLAEDRQAILTYLATYLGPEAASLGSEGTRPK